MYKYVQSKFVNRISSKGRRIHHEIQRRNWSVQSEKRENATSDDVQLYQEPESMNQELNLNLGLEEFVIAVSNQPRPLVIPLCAELPLPDISPLEIYTGTRTGCGFLLESMEGSEKLARYSFIGIDPECVVSIGRTVEVRGNEPFVSIARDPEGNNPVDRIRSILSRFHYMNVKAPRFFGGMVGYFAYDCVYSLFEKVPKRVRKGPRRPAWRTMPASCSQRTALLSITWIKNYSSFPARSLPTIPTLRRNIAGAKPRSTPSEASLADLRQEISGTPVMPTEIRLR